jgi:hypothetical protein
MLIPTSRKPKNDYDKDRHHTTRKPETEAANREATASIAEKLPKADSCPEQDSSGERRRKAGRLAGIRECVESQVEPGFHTMSIKS